MTPPTSAPAMPTLADLDALPAALTVVAPPAFEDENGHVNVRHYYDLHMRGADAAFTQLGFSDDYRERTGQSIFSVEHHIRFHSEALVGHELSVHMRLIERSDKMLHAMTILANRTTGRIANAIEFMEAHVDLTTRRASPFTDELSVGLDRAIAEHAQLPWDLPRSQPVGLRR